MSDNVINLPSKERKFKLVFETAVYVDEEGCFDINAEISEDFSKEEIFETMLGCAFKYAADMGIALDEE